MIVKLLKVQVQKFHSDNTINFWNTFKIPINGNASLLKVKKFNHFLGNLDRSSFEFYVMFRNFKIKCSFKNTQKLLLMLAYYNKSTNEQIFKFELIHLYSEITKIVWWHWI